VPSYSRRNEEDVRAGRLESEVRASDLQRMQATVKAGGKVKFYQCSNCHRLFEERSRTCPRCDTRTMGSLDPIGDR